MDPSQHLHVYAAILIFVCAACGRRAGFPRRHGSEPIGTIPVARWSLPVEAKEAPPRYWLSCVRRRNLGPELGPSFVPRCDYLGRMPKAFDFCIPTRGTKVPQTPDWLHEI